MQDVLLTTTAHIAHPTSLFFQKKLRKMVKKKAGKTVEVFRDLEERWIEDIDDNVRRILCIGTMLDPRFKTIKDTASEFTESMLDMDTVFEFELLDRWVPKERETVCSVVTDGSTVTTKASYRSMGTTGDPVPVGQRDVPVNHFTG